MSRKRTRNKTHKMPRSRKEQEDPFERYAFLDTVDAMPTPKPVKHVQPKTYVPPSQKERFKRLEIPHTVYGKLREWGATREAVEPVLTFLERLKFYREAQKATIHLAERVYGRARNLYQYFHSK